MGSTRQTENEFDFDVAISPEGGVECEYDRADEVAVRSLLQRLERVGGRSPRLLPGAEEILTPEETASHLGIPKKTVIFLCAEGRLEGAFKAGRRWRVPGRAVRKLAGVP